MPEKNGVIDFGSLLVQVIKTTADVIFLFLEIFYHIIISLTGFVIRKQQKSVRGEIVLITGGGHGMGRELSLLYASEGATVVLWDINETNGKATVDEIKKRGCPQAHFFLCDVSKRENVLDVAKKVNETIGTVTILINNAGIMPTHPFLEHTSTEIERIMNINVMAHYWTLEAFLPIMKKHNYGHIVCLTSTAGLSGVPNLVPYCCSKFAVRGLMEALYQECRADKNNQIKFTSVFPYMVDTGLCKKPKIRFEKVMPMVKADKAAEEIMRAQRLELKEIIVPPIYKPLFIINCLLPLKAQEALVDFFAVGLDSDLSK